MTQNLQSDGILVLGAGGKLARMVRSLWARDGGPASTGVWRKGPVPQGDIAWLPGADCPRLKGVHTVLALWGVTSGDATALRSNRQLALSAQTMARQCGAELVVHCSSAAVYGTAGGALTEQRMPVPVSAYGRAKLEMEQAIADWQAAHPDGPRTVVLRIGNVAGADSLFANLRPGGRVTLHRFADGAGPRRSYLSPQDLARTLVRLTSAPSLAGLYNLSAAEPTAMADLAHAAGAGIDWVAAPEGAVQEVRLNTTRLTTALPGLTLTAQPQELVDSARIGGIWP